MSKEFYDDNVLTPTREKEDQKLKPPGLYNCVMVNDDFTPMEFVVAVLMQLFNKTEEQAAMITMDVHQKGKGIAGTFPKDIAETKAAMAAAASEQAEHPFLVQVEAQGED